MWPVKDAVSDGGAFPDGEPGGSTADAAGSGASSACSDSSTPLPAACFFFVRGALGEGGTAILELPDVPDGDDCSDGGGGCSGGGVAIVASPSISDLVRRSPARLGRAIGRASCIIVTMFWLDAFSDGDASSFVLCCTGDFSSVFRAGLSDHVFRHVLPPSRNEGRPSPSRSHGGGLQGAREHCARTLRRQSPWTGSDGG
jgi:hypothetical protein